MSFGRPFYIAFISSDLVCAIFSWASFFVYRKKVVTPDLHLSEIIHDSNLLTGCIVIPVCWIIWYYFMGTYHHLFHKSIINLFYETLFSVWSGTTVILLFVLVDDDTLSYITYLRSYGILFLMTFSVVWISRVLLMIIRHYNLSRGYIHLATLVIYDEETDVHKFQKKYNKPVKAIDFLSYMQSSDTYLMVDEIVLLLKNEVSFKSIKNTFYRFNEEAVIKIPSDFAVDYLEDLSLGIFSNMEFISLKSDVMPVWQRNAKRIGDIFMSLTGILVSSPVLLYAAYKVHLSSPGPIFYRQKRIGKNGEAFEIIKLRSMYDDAEDNGPALSSTGDTRVTPWGKWMRRYRIDELPQLWNVLKGEMSIVGPRPERPFFISKLSDQNDQLKRLFLVRPGITSWGQVKYGYASDISQMLKRLKFDLLYLENRSIYLDLRIMISTLWVILKGEGK